MANGLMASVGLPILLMFMLLHTSTSSIHERKLTAPFPCHPEQAAYLLQLKLSFVFDTATTTLPSWQAGTDCCLWEGVGCHTASGHVTALELSGRGLFSYRLDESVFYLSSLERLDLSRNNFGGSSIPATGFENLPSLTHLNLSYAGFFGQIPVGIGKLTHLVSLDLTCFHIPHDDYPALNPVLDGYNELVLLEHTLHTFMESLGNLRELYLDGVNVYSSGEEWCDALATCAPRIQVLSMERCGLWGPIHPSLSSLHSLVVLNLQYNKISGDIPEFLGDFLDLGVLRLAWNYFDGWFPQRIFQLKNLKILDVSGNSGLCGHLLKFPEGNMLEVLSVQWTNFSGIEPSTFSNLTVKELSMDWKFINMKPHYAFGELKALKKLEISMLGFSGDLEASFAWIGHTGNLSSLKLSDYHFPTAAPRWIGKLKNLRTLEISSCSFSGTIPSTIINLKKLVKLTILSCSFTGPIPPALGSLKNLQILYISNCPLSGSIPSTIGNIEKMTVLILAECGLSGPIPSSVTNLTQLIFLDLSNNHLTGVVPTYLFTLPALRALMLSSNQLSGPIEEFDPMPSRFALIDLSNNQLTGQIMMSFFELASLVYLDLASNNLAGSLDLSSLWRLRKLDYLSLSNNKLSVLDGTHNISKMPLLPNLHCLYLASCNITKFPTFVMNKCCIDELDLSSNQIQGTIPMTIWSSSFIFLNLSYNMLSGVQLSTHVLSNSIPIWDLDLSSNRFEGQNVLQRLIPYLGQIFSLKMSNNSIDGEIPYSICNLSNLGFLDLSLNHISGPVPSCLIEDGHLIVINLRENQLEGTLDYNDKDQCTIETINLHGNMIGGKLPRTLSNCINLEVLDLGNNQIVDNFPSWLGRLPNLRVLVLRSNRLYGSIDLNDDKLDEHFPSLQIIDLASNNFSGILHPQWFDSLKSMQNYNNTGYSITHQNISTEFYHDTITITDKGIFMTFERILTTLTAIDLSDNALSGSIPGSIGRLISLHVLNMSLNAFTGGIPPELGRLSDLESLDLSSNQLSGEIPQELTNITFLSMLNLSNNELVGRIPQSRQFATFEGNSYEGNPGLCGEPVSRQCGSSIRAPSEAPVRSSSELVDIVLFLFVGIGFGVGFATGVLLKLSWIDRWLHFVTFRRPNLIYQ